MGANTWTGLQGTPGYLAGVSGTVTVPAGAILIAIVVHATAASTLTIFGGASIPIPANTLWTVDFKHMNFQAFGTGAQAQLVLTGTDSYFIHWNKIGNVA